MAEQTIPQLTEDTNPANSLEMYLTDEDRLKRDAYLLGAQVSPGEVETVRSAWSEVVG